MLRPVISVIHASLFAALVAVGNPAAELRVEWNDEVVEELMAASCDATEFGLVPDAAVDQTRMLQDAIEWVAVESDLTTVFVPAGVYTIAGQLRLPPGVGLIGEGPGRTVIRRGDEAAYLLRINSGDHGNAVIARLTLSNPLRTVFARGASKLRFHEVEIAGGMVRLENCSDFVFENNRFTDNRGKGGYASSECERMRIVGNHFQSIENGSINLSGHRDCYVADNTITAERLIDSGYAGIRLPNGAMRNLVENNRVENHGRGLFVLSNSSDNVLRRNTVIGTTYQGVFIQSPRNRLEANTIVDAGAESILLNDGSSPALKEPSPAKGNAIIGNVVYDTRNHGGDRFVGIRITGPDNQIEGNVVSTAHGRRYLETDRGLGNRVGGNRRTVDPTPAAARESGSRLPVADKAAD